MEAEHEETTLIKRADWTGVFLFRGQEVSSLGRTAGDGKEKGREEETKRQAGGLGRPATGFV